VSELASSTNDDTDVYGMSKMSAGYGGSVLAPRYSRYVEISAPNRSDRRGVGMGTIYRHFPTRADLVTAVYHHQIEECAEAGPRLLASAESPIDALGQWIDLFVDFLVTKHGLAKALQSDSGGFETLHAWFLDRLVPVCGHLLDAAVDAGEIRPGTHAYELMRGIGNLCIGRDSDPRYDPRRLVDLLLAGLQMRDGQTP